MSEQIQVTSHVSRDFLQNSAYFNSVPKVVWEYVSNSVDNPRPGEPVSVDVTISNERIIVSDSGCGMSREGLSNFFQMHAENIRRGRGENVRGRYGTGKCAAFGIADELRVETSRDGILNVVELSRKEIAGSKSGQPFSVRDIVVNKATTEEDGTRVIVSGINTRNTEVPATIAYVERHLGRQLLTHKVVINEHVCEYQEPYCSYQRTFQPSPALAAVIEDLALTIKVSPIPLDKERAGVDILSKGIWHDTTAGTIETDSARRLFGEVDVPALEERYDTEKIPPFDNTRNMTLNMSNPMVVTLLGWIDECLHEMARELATEERERRATEEARQLEKQAQELARLLNDDFRSLQMELERVRRATRQREGQIIEDVPGPGWAETDYTVGGPEHGTGTGGEMAGPGDEHRPGSSLLEGTERGGPGKVTERKQRRSTFHVEYRHDEDRSPRSRYERDTRTIVVNLDHPQIARAVRQGGGIDGRQFREMTYEVALVEYAIALGHEKVSRDQYYEGADALFDLRETINRVSRAVYS